MAGLPWFKVYAAETLSDERFQGWDVDERGAWFTLVCVAWREGSIPGDQGSLARLLHVDGSRMRLLWSAIGDRFTPHPDYPGRLTSPRLEMEREDAERVSERKSAAGRKGATSRWETAKRENGRRMRVPSPGDAAVVANDSDKGRADTRQGKAVQPPAEADRTDLLPRPTTPLVAFLRETYPDISDPWASEAAWTKAYPRVDLLAEALKARAWEVSNPKNAKKDHARFLNGWFGRVKVEPLRQRNVGDLGCDLIPWYQRLTDDEVRAYRQERRAIAPDLDDAPVGITGPEHELADLNSKWRMVTEARS